MESPIPDHCDVAIIGGGPAGSTAASLLAKDGFSVVLLEKAKFPRNTVGESLIPFFWKYTDQIGLSDKIKKNGFIVKAGGVTIKNGTLQAVKFSDFDITRPGLHIERDIFDHLLIEHSKELGANVFEETTAVGVSDTANPTVKYRLSSGRTGQLKAKYLIDASGQSNFLGKGAGLRQFDDAFKFQSIWGYYTASSYLTTDFEVLPFEERYTIYPATGVVHLDDWGWAWHIILRNKASIGLILPRDKMTEFKAGGATVEEQFTNAVSKVPILRKLVKEQDIIPGSIESIRDYAYQSESLVVDQCFLAGDAAGFVDPINSAGVTFAFYAATLASWAIKNSIAKPHRSDFYKEIYQKHYEQRLKLFRVSAYPIDQIDTELIKDTENIFDFNSQTDIDLLVTQSFLSYRPDNILEILKQKELSYNVKFNTKVVESDDELF